MTKTETEDQIIKLIRIRRTDIFYNSYVWQKFRHQIMKKKKHRCELCWNGGVDGKQVKKYTKADVLHHIKPLKHFPEQALIESNMMALCSAHHKEMHPEEFKQKNGKFRESWE